MTVRRGAFLCFILSLVGLGLAGYLSYLHLGLMRGDLFGGAACGGAGSLFNCHAVSASRFAFFLGVPVAFLGLLGYLLLAALSLGAWVFSDSASDTLAALAGMCGLFLLADLFLLGMMVFDVRALCLLCLLTYGVNLLLFLIAWSSSGRRWSLNGLLPRAASPAGWLFAGVFVTGLAGVLAVHFSSVFFSRGGLPERVSRLLQSAPAKVDAAGSPQRGNPGAPVQIVAFTDFHCPLCRKGEQFNAIALAAHRSDVALTVKQFPLDKSCNPEIDKTVHLGACRTAEAAACAQEQGKFWELHDLLFHNGVPKSAEGLEAAAMSVGVDLQAYRACIASGRGKEAVAKDVAQGRSLGVGATPTLYINGAKIVGVVLPSHYDELIRQIKQKKGKGDKS